MPTDYESEFVKAEMTFLHQRVYDTEQSKLCFLNPLPADAEDFSGDEWSFLGPVISEEHAKGISKGELCPNTRESFSPSPPIVVPEVAFEPSTPPEATVLPFEIHLDQGKKQQSPFSLRTNAINAARVSLKRSFSTIAAGQENKPPLQVKPRSFAFINDKVNLPFTAYSGSKRHVSRPSSQPVDRQQRSIKDFFRSTIND